MELLTADLTPDEFDAIRQMLYEKSGIRLVSGKEGLVRSRLSRRMRATGTETYRDYLRFVSADRTGEELSAMVDALTTNKTSFYREPAHFDLLTHLLKRHAGEEVRIWSAGCSSGEEACTIAMVARETLGERASSVRILATDISATILGRATAGVYSAEAIAEVPDAHVRKYFEQSGGQYRAGRAIKSMIQYARLNLLGHWPMRKKFHVIFCRNVMIYFDKATQTSLVERFHGALVPDGHLFIGHSESLGSQNLGFDYVQPAAYQKAAIHA